MTPEPGLVTEGASLKALPTPQPIVWARICFASRAPALRDLALGVPFVQARGRSAVVDGGRACYPALRRLCCATLLRRLCSGDFVLEWSWAVLGAASGGALFGGSFLFRNELFYFRNEPLHQEPKPDDGRRGLRRTGREARR